MKDKLTDLLGNEIVGEYEAEFERKAAKEDTNKNTKQKQEQEKAIEEKPTQSEKKKNKSLPTSLPKISINMGFKMFHNTKKQVKNVEDEIDRQVKEKEDPSPMKGKKIVRTLDGVYGLSKANEIAKELPKKKKLKEKALKNSEIVDESALKQAQREQMINFLGIKEKPRDFTVDEDTINNAEFTLVAPTGVDPDEIETFMDKIKQGITEYKKANEDAKKRFNILLDEAVRLYKIVQEYQSQNEITSFVVKQKQQEEELREQIALKDLEIRQLKAKLKEKKPIKDIGELHQDSTRKLPDFEPQSKGVLPDYNEI